MIWEEGRKLWRCTNPEHGHFGLKVKGHAQNGEMDAGSTVSLGPGMYWASVLSLINNGQSA